MPPPCHQIIATDITTIVTSTATDTGTTTDIYFGDKHYRDGHHSLCYRSTLTGKQTPKATTTVTGTTGNDVSTKTKKRATTTVLCTRLKFITATDIATLAATAPYK
jgi:hypothetical protein